MYVSSLHFVTTQLPPVFQKKDTMTSAQVNFDDYWKSTGYKCKYGESVPSSGGYATTYVKAREGNDLIVPKNTTHVVAAYFGDPLKFNRGKDVTNKVIFSIRKLGKTVLPASTEMFGDPWGGISKELHVKIAMKEDDLADYLARKKKNRTTFEDYYRAVGKSIAVGEVPKKDLQYDVQIIVAPENTYFALPSQDALILSSYWGSPDDFSKGKIVTNKVIEMIRENGWTTFPVNTEMLGDPWYGIVKQLHVKVATVSQKEVELNIKKQNGKIGISFNNSLILTSVSAKASEMGLRAGLRITECEGREVKDVSQLKNIFAVTRDTFRLTVSGNVNLINEVAVQANTYAKRQAEIDKREEIERQEKEKVALARTLDKKLLNLLQEANISEDHYWVFAKNKLDFDSLQELSDNEMRSLGLVLGERKRLQKVLRLRSFNTKSKWKKAVVVQSAMSALALAATRRSKARKHKARMKKIADRSVFEQVKPVVLGSDRGSGADRDLRYFGKCVSLSLSFFLN